LLYFLTNLIRSPWPHHTLMLLFSSSSTYFTEKVQVD
jgi:hypothetical protein